METVPGTALVEAGLDAVALKPAEHRLARAGDLPVDTLVVDFEGHEHVPEAGTLRTLAGTHEVRLTVPVRADGFDPLGDDDRLDDVPAEVGRILVAGNPAYLDGMEQGRAIAPRLAAAAANACDPWVGTESVERVALAVGGTQFELLSATTERTVRALRAAGVEADVAVYAPTVLSGDEDAILDAVGDYVARRQSVRERLPADGPTDATATGSTRETLSAAAREFALVGTPERIGDRVESLRAAGVDAVVAYPARGLDAVLE